MKAPIKQILVSNGRRDVPLGGYSSPSAKSWLYKDLDFWPSGRRPLCIVILVPEKATFDKLSSNIGKT